MKAKEPRVKPKRLIILLGIVTAVIVVVGILALLGMAEWPLARALAWHTSHSGNVSVEGHTFNVPIFYVPEISKSGRQIDIMEYPRMLGGLGSVTVESTARILDEASINHWQTSLLDALSKHPNNSERHVPFTLHGKKLTFVCVDLVSTDQDSLICHAVGTDITASTMSSPAHIQETRAILETSN